MTQIRTATRRFGLSKSKITAFEQCPKKLWLATHQGEGFAAQLIDLEKTRPLLLGERDRIKDLEPLLRRAGAWSEAEVSTLLLAYVGSGVGVPAWRQRLNARQRNKEARR